MNNMKLCYVNYCNDVLQRKDIILSAQIKIVLKV